MPPGHQPRSCDGEQPGSGVGAAVPDFHNEIVDLVVSPGRAAARLQYTGHHRGILLGRAPTGRRISYTGAAFFCCTGDCLASVWVLGDLAALRRQLGA